MDADLGGGLIKKRIARRGEGKRGGQGVVIAFKENSRLFFIFGFSKNDRENLDNEEKEIYKKLAAMYLNAPIHVLEKMCTKMQLIEVINEKT